MDLARAGIHPYAWVVNQSLSPLEVRDPVLLARRGREGRYIDEVRVSESITDVRQWKTWINDRIIGHLEIGPEAFPVTGAQSVSTDGTVSAKADNLSEPGRPRSRPMRKREARATN